jgi:hypothetical protein
LERASIRWLDPGPSFTFLADPFGLWRDDVLHLFAEAYDYRDRRGVIDLLRFDRALELIDRRTVLAEPWHLSYPLVFEANGETWMLPEAHRSGTLTLYRAQAFPDRWTPVARLDLDTPAVDATPFFHEGLWWLAYSPSTDKLAKQSHLHLAYAEQLEGPWTTHPANPVRIDRSSSRPGGTVFFDNGVPVLPTQDCTRTYGGAVRALRMIELTPSRFAAEAGPVLRAPASAGAFTDGLHTLSACGDLTLIDAKRIDRSLGGLAIDAARALRRFRR